LLGALEARAVERGFEEGSSVGNFGTSSGCPMSKLSNVAQFLNFRNTARLQKGGFHMAILGESRRGRHAPNVRSTALGGK